MSAASVDVRDKITVLIINDRREIVEAIDRFLAQYAHVQVVGTAEGTSAAVDMAVQKHPRVVLCDFNRETPQTLERIRLLRQALPQSCIIVMSYDDDVDARELVHGAGASLFISKFNLGGELIPVLERCLPLD